MTADQHIVIFQQIVTVPDSTARDGIGFDTTYNWADRKLHASREQAVSAGFKLRGSDDFNVAVVRDGRLTWFGWMDEHLDDYDLDEVAEQIGLRS